MRNSLWLSSSFALTLGLTGAAQAVAQSITETMGLAYSQSTQLSGARAQQRATDEQVPQALSNWRPTVTLDGSVNRTHTAYAPPTLFNSAPGSVLPHSGYNSYNTSKTV